MTPTQTQQQAYEALRGALITILPSGTEVIKGQGNRVAMSKASDFVVMTAMVRQQIAQAAHDYDTGAETLAVSRGTLIGIQLDIYGAAAGDNAQVVTTMLRDDFGAAIGIVDVPDATQMPLVAGEQQWIERWMTRVTLQVRPAVVVPQQFADDVAITLTRANGL